MIKVKNISKKYVLGKAKAGTFRETMMNSFNSFFLPEKKEDDFWALKNISFHIDEGEILGILGNNGAGKSTLLKILSRITAPTKGSIELNGRVASLLEVGTGFHPELTGKENIFLNGAILGMTKKEVKEKYNDIVNFSGIKDFINTPVKRYSSGMYVRLAFSVAAHLDSDILLVDEVLAVGDIEFQQKCLGKIDSIVGKGKTVIFVSHNMLTLNKICTKGIILDQGEIKYSGTISDCIKNYMDSTFTTSVSLIPLNKIKNRSGNKKILFKKVLFFNPNNPSLPNPSCGAPFEIHIAINNHIKFEKNIYIRIQFKEISTNRVAFICNNELTGDVISSKESKLIKCIIPKFPLLPQEYSIDLLCYSHNQVHDKINNYCTVKVLTGDYFNTGVLPKKSKGVLVNHHWHQK